MDHMVGDCDGPRCRLRCVVSDDLIQEIFRIRVLLNVLAYEAAAIVGRRRAVDPPDPDADMVGG